MYPNGAIGAQPSAGWCRSPLETMRRSLSFALAVFGVSTASPAVARAQSASPTSAAITVADLRHRLFLYAHDSMEGRGTAERGHVKATAYIAAELARLGLVPAGDSGTFFQTLPVVRRVLDAQASIAVGTRRFSGATDFIARDQGPGARSIDGVTVIYGGSAADTASLISGAMAAGRFVLLTVPADAPPAPNRIVMTLRFREAAGIGIVSLDRLPPEQAAALRGSEPTVMTEGEAAGEALPTYTYVGTAMAEALMGRSLATVAPGTLGNTIRGTVRFVGQPVEHPVRNVVATLPGRDRARRSQYVAIGAHSDHVGMGEPVDHDSLLLANRLWRTGGADDPPARLDAAQRARLQAARDSVRRIRAPRLDSIFNGADDDASGSMGLLEVAEYFAKTPGARPARSLLFVWHAAEELGLWGSAWFTDHPTVPRDSIVAAINIDMIGRGGAGDLPGGGDDYLQLLGSRRLSTQYGDFIESINRRAPHRFRFDYQFDANGHPQQYYCRSDHWNYARYGIPTVFFSTGGHADYHMVTDEAQYLDYRHFQRVTRFVADVARAAGDRPTRFPLDKPVPGPDAECVQ